MTISINSSVKKLFFDNPQKQIFKGDWDKKKGKNIWLCLRVDFISRETDWKR